MLSVITNSNKAVQSDGHEFPLVHDYVLNRSDVARFLALPGYLRLDQVTFPQ